MGLTGKHVVITGAVGAIGSSVARALAADGARVSLLDVADGKLKVLAAEIGACAHAVTVDLATEQAIIEAVASVIQYRGTVDVLVNNAGILSNNKIDTMTMEEWRRVNAINVESALLLSKAFLPGMRERKWGRIINVSSYAAKSGGLTAGTAYSVSKSAMIGLTFSIARETAHQGITANAVAPAYVMSPMVSEQLTEEQRQKQRSQIPVGRFCEPEEVAHTIRFLASPLAGFITGEVIDMNGGLHFD